MRTAEQRFWAKVDKTDTCWVWTASTSRGGYGQFSLDGRPQRAPRVAYEWLIGPIPPGLVLDHLCRNPPCVNPAHLKPGTDRDNIYAPGSQVITKINGLATRCKHGHEFDTANTYVCNDGERVCRACRRERMRHYSKKAKP